jgi:glucokinase
MEEDEFLGRHPVLIGDIGGTNARLSIKLMSGVRIIQLNKINVQKKLF